MVYVVVISKTVLKQLGKLPPNISRKLNLWIQLVADIGLEEARMISGLHDEPLQGKRFGQRSVRLNKAYRVIYTVRRVENEKYVQVEEIHKHAY